MSETNKDGKEMETSPSVQRDEKGKVLPGSVLNPGGRPRSGHAYTDIVRELLDSNEIDMVVRTNGKEKRFKVECRQTFKYAIAARQIAEAMSGNTRAAKELIDRSQGRAHQSIALKTTDLTDAESPLSDEQMAAAAEAIEKAESEKDES